MRCFICNATMIKSPVDYPDGKNPCPACVKAYQVLSDLEGTDDPGEVEVDDHDHPENEVLYNFPVDDVDY